MAEQPGQYSGQQFGNYRLMHMLGRGGFADVYLGQQIYLNTHAAIKVLRTHLNVHEQEDFLNEARMIARLIHPHIIRVLDFGMRGELPYLVMDYAPDGSLRDRHAKGSAVPLTTIITYVQQIAQALQYAHDQKLIHRDIKPENMLIGQNNDILLSDFGISVIAQSSQSQRLQEVVGTVPYMAPEQLEGRPRPASDQYALAITVYEWLSGARPFQGSFTEIYSQHMFSAPPSLRVQNPAIPPAVEQVVMTALAKDPHQRFATVQAFARALGQTTRDPASQLSHDATTQRDIEPLSPPSEPPLAEQMSGPQRQIASASTPPLPYAEKLPSSGGRRLPRRTFLIGGLVAVAATGASAGWYAYSHRFPPRGTPIFIYPSHTDTIDQIAWKGERVASASADKTVQVWEASSGKDPVIYRQHTAKVNSVAWSPDGTRIASCDDDSTVHIWNPLSADKALFIYRGHKESSNVYNLSWSLDGNLIASCSSDGTVQIWDVKNGRTQYTYNGHQGDLFTNDVFTVHWSPDGTRIASAGSDNEAHIWNPNNGKLIGKYTGHSSVIYAVCWSPDGTRITSASRDKTARVWQVPGNGQQVTSANIYAGHTDDVTNVDWSHDGQFLATTSRDKTVHIWSPDFGSKNIPPFIYKGHNDETWGVAWSEDSHRVVSCGKDKTARVWEAV